MKKWMIVEDRPWVMFDFIQKIDEKAKNMENREKPVIVYYVSGDTEEQQKANENNYRKKLEDFETQTGLKIERVSRSDFAEKMDKYYLQKYIIFMDLNLTGNNAMYFNERINVQYAQKKKQESGGEEEQIWFYTTGASLDANFLRKEFPDNVIEVRNFEDGKAHLDENKSWQLLCDQDQKNV